ncbi:MAG: glyoxalase/bleomycin resistance/extradiol dioxygenase family protein [Flavobacteriaceae bacterium]|nr:glyoxalase/bleomycin resistance/extradiol dioxygenase family protein [Flavobacteriaceae bacterium]
MRLNSYITFNGNCEDAMNFYKDIFDGEFTTYMRFHEAPGDAFPVPDFAKDLVMHCTLEFSDCTLMASDTLNGDELKVGTNISLSINAAENEAASIYNSLLEGGQSLMPFEDAFWGGKFGIIRDKFGIQWMVSSEHKPA